METTIAGAKADVAQDVATLYSDGIVGKKAAFTREWAEQLREDMMTAFWEAIRRPGGAVGRGPRRWYIELHPENIHGFVDLVTHPWVTSMCEVVLGPQYEIVEIGFDTPFQGAEDQPWHRDFPSPRETYEDRRITSLAFNLTGVDVTEDMGPFEIAPGTQWDSGLEFAHQMFPAESEWPRFAALGQRKLPRRGDFEDPLREVAAEHADFRNNPVDRQMAEKVNAVVCPYACPVYFDHDEPDGLSGNVKRVQAENSATADANRRPAAPAAMRPAVLSIQR